MSSRSRPTPAQIAHSPELAILCALDEILEIASRALIAAHPVLGNTEAPYWARDSGGLGTAAGTLMARAARLRPAIHAYVAAATSERNGGSEDDFDISF